MKYLTAVSIILFLLSSCTRNNNLNVSGNSVAKLKSITSDSAGTLQFGYTGDTITNVSGSENANIQYISNNDTPSISVLYSSGETIKYFLNSFKLPVKIVFYDNSGVEITNYGVDFFYQNGTSLLDSAIVRENGPRLIYKTTYSGNNISGIQESYVYATDNVVVANFNYTYSSENNIFRKTDSLLFIYSYIQPVLSQQAMVAATFFAETFSASTFSSIQVSGITSDYVFPNNEKSTMTPSVNKYGKIVAERFSDPVFEGLAGKRYIYE